MKKKLLNRMVAKKKIFKRIELTKVIQEKNDLLIFLFIFTFIMFILFFFIILLALTITELQQQLELQRLYCDELVMEIAQLKAEKNNFMLNPNVYSAKQAVASLLGENFYVPWTAIGLTLVCFNCLAIVYMLL